MSEGSEAEAWLRKHVGEACASGAVPGYADPEEVASLIITAQAGVDEHAPPGLTPKDLVVWRFVACFGMGMVHQRDAFEAIPPQPGMRVSVEPGVTEEPDGEALDAIREKFARGEPVGTVGRAHAGRLIATELLGKRLVRVDTRALEGPYRNAVALVFEDDQGREDVLMVLDPGGFGFLESKAGE